MVSFRKPALVGSGPISLWKLFDCLFDRGKSDFWKVKNEGICSITRRIRLSLFSAWLLHSDYAYDA